LQALELLGSIKAGGFLAILSLSGRMLHHGVEDTGTSVNSKDDVCAGVEECPATVLRREKLFLSPAFVLNFLCANGITRYVVI
jgi:hypothetical protein